MCLAYVGTIISLILYKVHIYEIRQPVLESFYMICREELKNATYVDVRNLCVIFCIFREVKSLLK